MTQEMPVSEVRQNLSGLLKRLQKNHDLSIRITLNGIPVGELRAAGRRTVRRNVGEVLLKISESIGSPEILKSSLKSSGSSVSENHDQYLY